MSKSVKVTQRRVCDLCKMVQGDATTELALYDAKTVYGPWANVCQKHFESDTSGELGTGKGQRLIYEEANNG